MLWTAVDEDAHSRPQPPWKTPRVTLRVTHAVSHNSLEIPAKSRRDSHSPGGGWRNTQTRAKGGKTTTPT